MTWITLPAMTDYRHAFREIKKQRDRGAGIIAAAILQDYLKAAIKTRLTGHKDIEGKMFKSDGALGSFASQIDLGFLFDLYPDFVREQLHVIRTIRNEFAHNPHPVSFRSQRELCAQLNPPKGAAREWAKLRKAETKDPFLIITNIHSSKNPRTQFIRAVQRYTMHLAMHIAVANSTKNWIKERGFAPQPSRASRGKFEAQPYRL